ncbi:MAG: DUF58 domain-containing protein [Planctomycetota bacterium]
MPLLFDSDFLKKLEYLDLVAKKILRGEIRAEKESERRGTSLEFADYRRYVAGDDLRYIDWNVYGRLDVLVLKQFQEEEDIHLYVFLDRSRSMGYGRFNKFDYARRLAAAFVYLALANGDRASVVPFSDTAGEGLRNLRGKKNVIPTLEFLGNIAPAGETRMAASFRRGFSGRRGRGVAVVISDFFSGDSFEDGLSFLASQRFDVHVIHVYDPRERRPEFRGALEIEDIEAGTRRDIEVTPGLLESYAAAFGEHQEGILAACRRLRLASASVSTEVPFEATVLQLLRERKILA